MPSDPAVAVSPPLVVVSPPPPVNRATMIAIGMISTIRNAVVTRLSRSG